MNTMTRLAAVALLALTAAAGVLRADDKDDAARTGFTEAKEQSARAATGAEGLALWDAFLADHPDSPLTEAANRERAVWKQRADDKLARFGGQWLDIDDVAKRSARADELLQSAESADTIEAKEKLLAEAGRAHPFRVDIPWRRFELMYEANRLREANLALGDVLKADPENVPARNNLGVLAAVQKQWPAAIAQLCKAAGGDNDVAFDNLDETIERARADGYAGAASADAQVQGVVSKLHRRGKHVGEGRWGNAWVADADQQARRKEAAELDRKARQLDGKMRQLSGMHRGAKRDLDRANEQVERYSKQKNSSQLKSAQAKAKQAQADVDKIEDAAKKLKAEADELDGQRPKASHAGRLVLLKLDGSELGEAAAPPDDADDPADDDDATRKKGRKGDRKGRDKKGDDDKGGGLFD